MYIISFIQKQSFRKHTASTKKKKKEVFIGWLVVSFLFINIDVIITNVILPHYVGTDNMKVVSLVRKAGFIRAGLIPCNQTSST